MTIPAEPQTRRGRRDSDAGLLLDNAHLRRICMVGREVRFSTSMFGEAQQPEIERFTAATSSDADRLELVVSAPDDIAYLQVTLVDDTGRRHTTRAPRNGFSTTAPKRYTGVTLTSGKRLCARVRGIDTAGNETDEIMKCAKVSDLQPYPVRQVQPAPVLAARLTEVAFAWLSALGLALLATAGRRRLVRRAHGGTGEGAARDEVSRAALHSLVLDLGVVAIAVAAIAIAFDQLEGVVEAGWCAAPAVFIAALAVLDAVRARRVTRLALDDETHVTCDARRAYITRHGWLLAWQRYVRRSDPRDLPAVHIVRVR